MAGVIAGNGTRSCSTPPVRKLWPLRTFPYARKVSILMAQSFFTSEFVVRDDTGSVVARFTAKDGSLTELQVGLDKSVIRGSIGHD